MNRKQRRKQKKSDKKAATGHLDAESLFDVCADNFRAGNMAAAEKNLRRYLQSFADHASALHLLGLTLYQCGRLSEAERLIERAIRIDGGNSLFHSNHGVVLNLMGRAIDGENACRRALALQADNAEACNNLGVALKLQGRLPQALDACRRAIEFLPGYIEAYINVGNIQRQQGLIDDAIVSYGQALKLAPDNSLAHSNLAAALRESGDMNGAMDHCQRAVALRPDNAEAHNNLANVLMTHGDMDEAEAAYRRALDISPGYMDARVNLAGILFAKDNIVEAEDTYHQAIKTNAGHADAHNGLGVVLLAAGRLDEALVCFNSALKLHPGHVQALYNLAASGTVDFDQADLQAIEDRLRDIDLDKAKKIALHFSLGDIYDNNNQFNKAFDHYRNGNNLRKSALERQGYSFDANEHDCFVDEIIKAYPSVLANRPKTGDKRDETPVFIVGMPRSGTTLVEQIAASHPQVHGAGELNKIASLLREPTIVPSAERQQTIAGDYSKTLDDISDGAIRVIDKTPFNYFYLGAIALIFPHAKVIYCQRQSRDLCLSNYFQNFVAPYPWSTDLDDISRYLQACNLLMDHWHGTLGLNILDVNYEELVGDAANQSRRIIDFLALAWDDACLDFHKNRRSVKTASSWQVRRPIYATSVGRWRNYKSGY